MSHLRRASRSLGRWWASLAGGPGAGPDLGPLDGGGPGDHRGRAVAAHRVLEHRFRLPGGPGRYRESAAGTGDCFLWPFSRVASAVLDLGELGVLGPEAAHEVLGPGLDRYRRADGHLPAYDSAVRPPWGPGGDRYYDDNAWIGLDLVRLHRLTGDRSALDRAGEVFAFLVGGWDDDPRLAHPGGVRWVESASNHDRNTVSTATAAQLGFLLAAAVPDPAAGAWAGRMLGWVHEVLRDPADGLYWDHVEPGGRIERTKWSYNQGNVVAAELARAAAPGGERSGPSPAGVPVAEAVARAVLDRDADGRGRSGGLTGRNLPFDAVLVRTLVDLAAVSDDAALVERLRPAVVGVADAWWAAAVGRDGLVRPGGRGRAASVIDQAAMVELQACCAAL